MACAKIHHSDGYRRMCFTKLARFQFADTKFDLPVSFPILSSVPTVIKLRFYDRKSISTALIRHLCLSRPQSSKHPALVLSPPERLEIC